MLVVGIPKEIKAQEKRVGLTPSGTRLLSEAGISVLIEAGAGSGSGFTDEAYHQAGAKIIASKKELYEKAGLIQKVKEPLPEEYSFFQPEQIIFGFLHLAAPENCDLLEVLLKRKVTSIAYEAIEKEGKLPLLAPMSDIAGGLSACYAVFLLERFLKQRRKIDSEGLENELEAIAMAYPEPALTYSNFQAVVFGAGSVGLKAAETFKGFGGKVTLLEKNETKRRELLKAGWNAVSPDFLEADFLRESDILVGAVHARGQRAVKVVDMIRLAQISKDHPKVIMDISIDQGGNFPESVPTTYEHPVYYDASGNLRFCVPNIPSFAGRQASEALSEISLPYTLALAKDTASAMRLYPELVGAVNTAQGEIKLAAIQDAHKR